MTHSKIARLLTVAILTNVLLASAWALDDSPAQAATRCSRTARNAAHPRGVAARITGWLHTCRDGTIRNAKGRKIRLNGLEYFRLGGGNAGTGKCDHAWTPLPPMAPSAIAGWGFNSVELFFSWQNLEPTPPTFNPVTKKLEHHYDPVYLADLDSAIRQLTSNGLGVVLVLMQSRWSGAFQDITTSDGAYYPCGVGLPAWIYERNGQAAGNGADMVKAEVSFFQNTQRVEDVTYKHSETMQTSFIKMWRFLAKHYVRKRRVVGAFPMFEAYDILTRSYQGAENVRPGTIRLASFFERVTRAIHGANPHLVNFFAEQKSRTTGKWAMTRRPRVPNGASATEFYNGRWPGTGKRRLSAHYLRAKRWRYPFYVDEFDAFGMGRNKPTAFWQQDTIDMLKWEKGHQVSWSFNSYQPGGLMVMPTWTDPKTDLLRALRRGF